MMTRARTCARTHTQFANNVITMLEALSRIVLPEYQEASAPAADAGGARHHSRVRASGSALRMWWFSVNDDEDDEVGQYKARRRARLLFGDRFVLVRSGEQRPDHSAYHEGVAAAAQIRAYSLHMLFNLPGKPEDAAGGCGWDLVLCVVCMRVRVPGPVCVPCAVS